MRITIQKHFALSKRLWTLMNSCLLEIWSLHCNVMESLSKFQFIEWNYIKWLSWVFRISVNRRCTMSFNFRYSDYLVDVTIIESPTSECCNRGQVFIRLKCNRLGPVCNTRHITYFNFIIIRFYQRQSGITSSWNQFLTVCPMIFYFHLKSTWKY